jgi:hypothetical protein
MIDCITSKCIFFWFPCCPSWFLLGWNGKHSATCEVSGFWKMLLGSQFLYNFGLAIYFWMIIYYGRTEKFILVAQAPIHDHPILRFVIGILVRFIVPLQGLFNLIIYIRPKILIMKERYGTTRSYAQLLWCVVHGEKSFNTINNHENNANDNNPECSEIRLNHSSELNNLSTGRIEIMNPV